MNIELIPAYEHTEKIEKLFKEYTDMLLASDPEVRVCLNNQHYDDELLHLETKYGMPDGRLYLVYCDGEAAGCIGLRKMDNERCEMKRLYVREKFRGQKLGKLLVQHIISDAREIGYKYILLDTLTFLKSAIHLYHECGFYEIERYNDNELDAAIFMRLDL